MSCKPTRRSFLEHAALFSLTVAAAPPRVVANGLTPIKRAGAAHLRTSLNAYSFVELLNAHAKDPARGIDLFQLCDFCAEHDFDAVDLTGYFFPGYPQAPGDEYLFKLKRHALGLGLEISGTGVRNDFTAGTKAVRDEGVQRVKTWIEVAAKLGAPVIRAFADSQPPYKTWREASGNSSRAEVEAWMADCLRVCADHGQKFGVMVGVQNHGDFITSAVEHLGLLERVNHPWCAALVDTGNYLTADPYADIARVVPFAVNWQIKERIGNKPDSPLVDMRKLVTIIRGGGYRGYLPIETLAQNRKDYDSFVEVPKMLEALRRAIKQTAPGAR